MVDTAVMTNRCGLLLLRHGCCLEVIVNGGIGVKEGSLGATVISTMNSIWTQGDGRRLGLTGWDADVMFDKAVFALKPWCPLSA